MEAIRCRIAACREPLDDGNEWSFYLINDTAQPIDVAVLDRVSYEWGDIGNSEKADVTVRGLRPGAHALLWRDDGSGAELRMDFSVRVQVREREVKMLFEFPKLYRKHDLPLVEGLGKAAYEVAAESQ
jgi:hypothetical protein